MTFTLNEQKALQRIANERPAHLSVGVATRTLAHGYGLGQVMGTNVFYTPEHWQQARKLLQNHDLPLQSLPQDSKRSAAAMHGGMSEKLGTRGVHKGEVAFKLLGNCRLDGQQVALPPQLSLVSKAEDLLVCVECDVVCVVENWETFTDLHHYEWIDWQGKSAMVIFHGDNIYSNENAKRAVEARSEPIWAFMDFDPAGLGFSTILPQTRLERVVLPDFEWLATAAKNTIGRMLFDDQVGQWGPTLDRCSHPEIKKAWEALRSQRAGVTQERMLGAHRPLPEATAKAFA